MYLAMNDMQAIRSVIDTLRIPSLETRVSALRFWDVCRESLISM